MIPTSILGTKQIYVLLNIPDTPTTFAASTGENTKADAVAALNVLLIKLVNPNTNPKNAPYFGPKNSAPKITGMWMTVALITTSGIYPSGVNAIMTIMAVKSAVSTSS